MKRWPLLLSFLLFLGLCMSATYWVIQFIKPQARPVAQAKTQPHTEVDPEQVLGLFGGHLSVAAASNFQLRGVVVSKNDSESVAILVADGKPAEAIRVGSEIVPGVVLKEVHPQYVMLSENGAMKRVEIPVNTPAHGDLPTLPIVPPAQPPVVQQQIPQPGQPEPEPQQAQQPPPPQPPQQDPAQGRIGRSAQRMRNNLNN